MRCISVQNPSLSLSRSTSTETSMYGLQRLNKLQFFNRVPLFCFGIGFRSSKSDFCSNGPRPVLQFLRFGRTESAAVDFGGGNICQKRFLSVREEAQATLLEYFHQTRNLPFIYAESLSRNSPEFLGRLLNIVLVNGDDGDVGHSLARFLRYHPVNEFEPFFESIGLDPCQYASFLPRNSIFLSDDELLLHNYHVLYNYGIEKNKIGKIYVEAKEVFTYGHGVLQSRLKALQEWGLPQYLLVEMIATAPHLLRSDEDEELRGFLKELKNLGIHLDWLEKHIKEADSCDWKHMIEVMRLLGELGFTEEQSREVIFNRPNLLLSSSCTLCLFSLLLKFGLAKSDMQALFHQFPDVSVASFTGNLLQGYQFLLGINMPSHDIARMFRLHTRLLGECQLKTIGSLVHFLNCGTRRIREMVDADPYVLKNWVLGVRVDPVPGPSRVARCRTIKTKFLERLGFVENSEEMEKADKLLKGRADELEERFDCLVNSGLSEESVAAMVKSDPRILNMSKDVLERKIDLLVRELGYPVSVVLEHPVLLGYNTKRLKLRVSMHKWLKDEGAVKLKVTLRTFLKYNEAKLLRCCVNTDPRGPQVWERMKEEMDKLPDLP